MHSERGSEGGLRHPHEDMDMTRRLLGWFDREKRDLPWRRTRDPYKIWVSEIMLQQTQVERVIGYYERFMAVFPDVRSLAAASIDAVLQQWQGLGYYSRARNLHMAAQEIVRLYDGEFPRDFEDVRALPGVGTYTAGAIMSIAFGEPVPAIDVNALRVLARVHHVEGDLRKGDSRKRISQLAAIALDQRRPGDFNQALMELGAKVCTARRPQCEECCLRGACLAHKRGDEESIPSQEPIARRHVERVAGVVRRDGRMLIVQRPPEGVWGGLWEFPNVEVRAGEMPVARLLGMFEREFGMSVSVGAQVTQFRYGIMNRVVELSVLACELVNGEPLPLVHMEARWVRAGDLLKYAMPTPHRRLAERLREDAGQTTDN